MKIAMIGTGYVGLTSGACFAKAGHDVICVDKNPDIVASLKAGHITFYEPGLEEMVAEFVGEEGRPGRLSFTEDTREAVDAAEIIFIAVGTPPNPDGSVNLSYVETVAREIGEVLRPGDYKVVVDKSTVPVTTGEKVTAIIRQHAAAGSEFDVVSNPEFLREGTAVRDLLAPDRIVVGANSKRARALMWELYENFPGTRVDTDLNSAEIIKHAANSFLAMKISFINAVAAICDASNADIEAVAHGIGLDNRIGKSFLHAGLGYGGSCFPKDVDAFVAVSRDLGAPFDLLEEVVKINEAQRRRMLDAMREKLGGLAGKKIAVWGIAFKSNTDDIRESVAVKLIKELVGEGAAVSAFDPKGEATFRKFEAAFLAENAGKIELAESPIAATRGADALLVATEWPEFRLADFHAVKNTLATPLVFDGRNLLEPARMLGLGFDYHAVGRAGAIARARSEVAGG